MKFILTLSFFLLPSLVFAASVSISAPDSISIGNTEVLEITVDTEGEMINAVEGELVIPKQILSIEGVQDFDSIVGFWFENPVVREETVSFSGIIPGGFIGKGVLARVEVKGQKEGSASVRIPVLTIYLNDGLGTRRAARTHDTVLQVVGATEKELEPIESDTIPPDNFTVTLLEEDDLFEGKSVLIFATHDGQTGIAYYEVQHTNRRAPEEGKWIRGESPFVLPDVHGDHIFVRATDNAGNTTIAEYGETGILDKYSVIGAVVLGAVLLLLLLLWARRRNSQ